jgi:hypothetical protein
VVSVSFDQVPLYLVSADIGLLIRDNHLLNRYACPTKFTEYLASGLHVLTTPAVLDVVDTIRRSGVGTVMQDVENKDQLRADLHHAVLAAKQEKIRIERSVNVAKTKFDWGVYIPHLKKWYLQMAVNSRS